MKKTYEFKPLLFLILIFNLLLGLSTLISVGLVGVASSLLSGFSGVLGILLFMMILLIASIIGIIGVSALLYMFYLKEEKKLFVLIEAILNTIIALLSMIGMFNGFNNIILNVLYLLLSFGVLIISLIVALQLDGVLYIREIEQYLPNGKGAVVVDNKSIQPNNAPSMTLPKPSLSGAKISSFFKSKAGKITIGAVACVVILAGGLFVWNTFFNKTPIDLLDGVELTYSGYNGAGYAQVSKQDIDYDKTNGDIATFVSDVSYDIENNGSLSNGDKIKVTVIYSQETAKRLRLSVQSETKTFTVSNLTTKYQSASEIDQNIFNSAYNAAISKINDYHYNNEKSTYYKAYYVFDSGREISLQTNYLVFVFKTSYKSYDWNKGYINKTKYEACYVSIDSSYDPSQSYMASRSLYKKDSYEYVDKASDIVESINSSFSYGKTITVEEVTLKEK